MITKTKLALAAALLAATTTVSLAATQKAPHYGQREFQSAPASLNRGNVDEIQTDLNDRSSSPYAGGVG